MSYRFLILGFLFSVLVACAEPSGSAPRLQSLTVQPNLVEAQTPVPLRIVVGFEDVDRDLLEVLVEIRGPETDLRSSVPISGSIPAVGSVNVDLQVVLPRAGTFVAEVRLRDAAGNTSEALMAEFRAE